MEKKYEKHNSELPYNSVHFYVEKPLYLNPKYEKWLRGE